MLADWYIVCWIVTGAASLVFLIFSLIEMTESWRQSHRRRFARRALAGAVGALTSFLWPLYLVGGSVYGLWVLYRIGYRD